MTSRDKLIYKIIKLNIIYPGFMNYRLNYCHISDLTRNDGNPIKQHSNERNEFLLAMWMPHTRDMPVLEQDT